MAAELIKTHSFRLLFWRFAYWKRASFEGPVPAGD